jgi:hypothetical protein
MVHFIKTMQNSKLMHILRMVHFLKLVHNGRMRTSVTLDDDVHDFVLCYSRGRGITLSAALNELIRKAEAAPVPEQFEFERSSNGLPLLSRTGRTITSEMVKQLAEDEFDPKKFA